MAVKDLREECEELDAFVQSLTERQWREPTPFWRWTTFDQVLHLFYVDRFALVSATDPQRFVAVREAHQKANAAGVELSTRVRNEYGHLTKRDVLALWRKQYRELCNELDRREPTERVAWFGPDMSIASMIAARQMEVWAHGQDVNDHFRVRRALAPRLRNTCELGVRTFAWSFQNRGLERPGPAPQVVLSGASGEIWRWNDNAPGLVQGDAEDFALVITKRRHVDDTTLDCQGDVARNWMLYAQCFAGPPEPGPEPGERVW